MKNQMTSFDKPEIDAPPVQVRRDLDQAVIPSVRITEGIYIAHLAHYALIMGGQMEEILKQIMELPNGSQESGAPTHYLDEGRGWIISKARMAASAEPVLLVEIEPMKLGQFACEVFGCAEADK